MKCRPVTRAAAEPLLVCIDTVALWVPELLANRRRWLHRRGRGAQ